MAVMLSEFRPTIWSSKLIVDVDKALVFGNVANRDYQGEITGKGNVVKINEIGDITVSNYSENEDITISTLTGAQKELVIDQAKYFAFSVDDVLAAQANVSVMSAAMQKAAHALSDTVDQYIASLYAQAGIVDTSDFGSTGASRTLYATGGIDPNMVTMITDMHRELDEHDAPSMGRWIVVPPFMHQYLKYAQIVDNSTGGLKTADSQAMGNGFIGSGLGFNWYASNNVNVSSTQYRVMFGTPDAISFAGQVTKIESGRVEKQFGDFVKGLYVYCAKVVRPDHLGTAYIAAGGLTT